MQRLFFHCLLILMVITQVHVHCCVCFVSLGGTSTAGRTLNSHREPPSLEDSIRRSESSVCAGLSRERTCFYRCIMLFARRVTWYTCSHIHMVPICAHCNGLWCLFACFFFSFFATELSNHAVPKQLPLVLLCG